MKIYATWGIGTLIALMIFPPLGFIGICALCGKIIYDVVKLAKRTSDDINTIAESAKTKNKDKGRE